MGAWLNYYIKSIRRLGRGPEFSADLGEKSGMTGSCERDACGGMWLGPDTVRSFTAHHPDRRHSTPARQGISSTDKDVIPEAPKVRVAGGFSSLLRIKGADGADRVEIALRSASDAALVDGRCRQGLDSGLVSVKLPLGVQEACAVPEAGLARACPDKFLDSEFAAPSGQHSDDGRTAVLRIKEVLRPVRHQPVRMEGVDPVATCYRTQEGIRRDYPAL